MKLLFATKKDKVCWSVHRSHWVFEIASITRFFLTFLKESCDQPRCFRAFHIEATLCGLFSWSFGLLRCSADQLWFDQLIILSLIWSADHLIFDLISWSFGLLICSADQLWFDQLLYPWLSVPLAVSETCWFC